MSIKSLAREAVSFKFFERRDYMTDTRQWHSNPIQTIIEYMMCVGGKTTLSKEASI